VLGDRYNFHLFLESQRTDAECQSIQQLIEAECLVWSKGSGMQFPQHMSIVWTKEIPSHSVTNSVIMRRKRGNQVWLFSSCQHATKTVSTGSKATKEISLAPTTKLFTSCAKKVSAGEADRGQWPTGLAFQLRNRLPQSIVTIK